MTSDRNKRAKNSCECTTCCGCTSGQLRCTVYLADKETYISEFLKSTDMLWTIFYIGIPRMSWACPSAQLPYIRCRLATEDVAYHSLIANRDKKNYSRTIITNEIILKIFQKKERTTRSFEGFQIFI